MTFTELSNKYLVHMGTRRGLSREYVNGSGMTYSQFVSHLRGAGRQDSIGDFNAETVESFVQTFLEAGTKGSTVCTKLAHLAALAKWGMKQKDGRGRWLVQENPVDRIDRPKRVKPLEKFLTLQELQ